MSHASYWQLIEAVARIDLGISEEEFWRLTPDKLQVFIERREIELMRQEFGPALIAASFTGKPILDFMPLTRMKGELPSHSVPPGTVKAGWIEIRD